MRKRLGVAALLVAGFIMMAVPVAHAQGFRSGPNVTVRGDETINGMLWSAGNTIDIAGTVEGDVFCAGQNVTISGTVQGDVICAAQTITISGTVDGDIRTAAQTVTITGAVAGSATTASQSMSLSGGGTIGKDLSVGSAEAAIGGAVARDVFLGSENATLTGVIGRNVNADLERLRVDGSAKVAGKVTYTSRNDASVDPAAQVQGGFSHSIPAPRSNNGAARQANVAFALFMTFALLVLSLMLVLLLPQFVDTAARHAISEPLKTFGTGVLFLFFAPILIFGLMVSVIGIPLALLAILLWLIILMLSGPMFAYMIGKVIWRSQDNALLIMLVGSLILMITYLLPVVRVITMLAALTIGSGMLILAFFRRINRPTYRVAPQKAEQ